MKTLRIDFVSDVVCPWCAIGLASLEQALQRTQGEVAADIHFQPFELNPQLPAEGEGIGEHLQRKYGLSEAQLAENQERIRARGAELGVVFDFNGRSRIWNTFDAHRLLHWAGIEGGQRALKHALLQCLLQRGPQRLRPRHRWSPSRVGAGLDAWRARRRSWGPANTRRRCATAEQFFTRNGINGVPAVIIERKHLVSGGQPVEVFERALREIAVSA
jgi:predicted DsbA family dithiol-disulfide isomerase